MKKLLSLVLVVCMLGAFALTASAAYAPTGFQLKITEKETTVEVAVIVKGTFSGLTDMKLNVSYNNSKYNAPTSSLDGITKTGADAEIDGGGYPAKDLTGWWKNASSQKAAKTSGTKTTVYLQPTYTGTDTASHLVGTDFVITTYTFGKKEAVTAASTDFELTESIKYSGVNYTTICYSIAGTADPVKSSSGSLLVANDFTAYTPAPSADPTVSLSAGSSTLGKYEIVKTDAAVDGSTTYEVVITTVPFGRKAAITADGEPIVAGTEYVVTEDTEVDVQWVDDETADDIVALEEVFEIDSASVALFAKFKGSFANYGFKVPELANHNIESAPGVVNAADAEGTFKATANNGGVFGIALKNLPVGTYNATAFADGETADAPIAFAIGE